MMSDSVLCAEQLVSRGKNCKRNREIVFIFFTRELIPNDTKVKVTYFESKLAENGGIL